MERIFVDAHEFAELRLLSALRSRALTLPGALATDAEVLLGEHGAGPAARLGLPPDAPLAALHDAAVAALERWQGRAENPMLSRVAADACRVAVRTCEGLLAALTPTPHG